MPFQKVSPQWRMSASVKWTERSVSVWACVVGEIEVVVLVGEGSVAVEEDGRESVGGSGWNDGFVGDDVLGGAHAVAGVLVGPDGGSGGVHPVVAVGVVEVPVGVDQDLNRVGVDGGEGGGKLRLAGGVAGVDEELALSRGEDGDVAASSAQEGDVAAEGSSGDLVVCVGGAGPGEEVLGLRCWLLGHEIAVIEAGDCSCGCRGGEELAAGDCWGLLDHEDSSFAVEDIWNGHGIKGWKGAFRTEVSRVGADDGLVWSSAGEVRDGRA